MTTKALALVVVIAACQREERRFDIPEVTSQPLISAEAVSFYAGDPPIGGAVLDPAMPGYVETAYDISEGSTLYRAMNCVGCHANGGGAIGPPFLDDAWRYGGDPYDIALSIIAGRPHGMPSYRGKLVARQVYQLTAYVRSLAGLVRGDAVPPRNDHMQSIPARNLTDGWVNAPKEAP